MSADYRRYPQPGPSRRAVWVLILLVTLMLIVNLIHQGVT